METDPFFETLRLFVFIIPVDRQSKKTSYSENTAVLQIFTDFTDFNYSSKYE
jgi:hypothetical protein